jgi:hypothetical protein
VPNYYSRLNRNKERENKFLYRSGPIHKDKITIPEPIQEQCIQVKEIKTYLKSRAMNPQYLIKYEPFANLTALRKNMLFVIRENYISNEEIINYAHK